jgi:hypothetical protein
MIAAAFDERLAGAPVVTGGGGSPGRIVFIQ